MAELLPTRQAQDLAQGLKSYLTTTFALSNKTAQDEIGKFLTHPDSGMFRGPYLRFRLPFEAAPDGWQHSLDIAPKFPPYGHQAEAFQRLSSKGTSNNAFRRPEPTVVTTGTGSGKTESFLYPILDHVLRANEAGIGGVKAVILYPMNALANDQASRLAEMITETPELNGVTAALYTGQDGKKSSRVTKNSLITDRSTIRRDTPDILLTNYKMLDMLLLRHEDQNLWKNSATSLQYLVLDEFHTYDGAQGTDVAMLLRRLGITLKSYWPEDLSSLRFGPTEEDRALPLGRITPIATSATLGSGEQGMTDMLAFAETVFGEEFAPDSLITESRMSFDEWSESSQLDIDWQPEAWTPVDDLLDSVLSTNAQITEDTPVAEVLQIVAKVLFATDGPKLFRSAENMLAFIKAHPLTQRLINLTEEAIDIGELTRGLFPVLPNGLTYAIVKEFLSHLITLYSHARFIAGREALTVETHLWVRELSRIDSMVDVSPNFRWADDGVPEADDDSVHELYLPAIYCRHCGKNGWGAKLAPTETEIEIVPADIRKAAAIADASFRPLMQAVQEAEAVFQDQDARAAAQAKEDGLRYLHTVNRNLVVDQPDSDEEDFQKGLLIPVITHTGRDAAELSRGEFCPVCLAPDAIRFLGSAISTLTSVAISNIFGTSELNHVEKKALVFTDSVQDAAHRAGFIQSRSHVFTLRNALRSALPAKTTHGLTLDALTHEACALADNGTAIDRFKLVPPELTHNSRFKPYWDSKATSESRRNAREVVLKRLRFDAAMELGLRARLGRTLELTGSVVAEVDAGPSQNLIRTGQRVWDSTLHVLPKTGLPSDEDYLHWIRGVLIRLRLQGGIYHPWLKNYIYHDGARYHIWGGRNRGEGMPAFPTGRPAPAFPVIGKTNSDHGLDPVLPRNSWYVKWTNRILGVTLEDAGFLLKELFSDLASQGVLDTHPTIEGATAYSVSPERIRVFVPKLEDLENRRHTLQCATCSTVVFGTFDIIDELEGAPCLQLKCTGQLQRVASPVTDYYRSLYSAKDSRRVVAREHTSLLEDKIRLEYEEAFKNADQSPDAPNVLVATPTLEMGIDIGDLSCVILASLPPTVASYIQRVGRAGRLTGNSLALAFVRGRGQHLPKLYDPLSVINGDVRPPATFLEAEEILTRQFVAYLVDRMARDPEIMPPRTLREIFRPPAEDTFFGQVLAQVEHNAEERVAEFTAQFGSHLSQDTTERLLDWAQNDLSNVIGRVCRQWEEDRRTLQLRIQDIERSLTELQEELELRRTEYGSEDHPRVRDAATNLRSAEAQRRRTNAELSETSTEYWISKLESYGLLPNYTLIGDPVTLDVGVSWRNEETHSFEAETHSFSRNARNALHELVPGATFYAQGLEVAVDAVELGPDQSNIEYWQICPLCGAKEQVTKAGTGYHGVKSSCGVCRDTRIEDIGNIHHVVSLRKVTAEIRRDEAAISDSREERHRARFNLVPIAAIKPENIDHRWFVKDTGFGAEYLRAVDVTWLNLGRQGSSGEPVTIASRDYQARRFVLCEYCGKENASRSQNFENEHRFWCKHRKSVDEHTRTVILASELKTQGVKLHLPANFGHDDFSFPTLKAAILLGLQEHLGGTPGNFDIFSVPDLEGDEGQEALLIHDIVPGGTGYLSVFRDHAKVQGALTAAWNIVRNCSCRDEDRLACHRCLLPFADPQTVPYVARVTAEEMLASLLGVDTSDPESQPQPWDITEETVKIDSGESALEHAFREAMKHRLAQVKSQFKVSPSARGEELIFSLPGQRNRWYLRPQQDIGNTRPDFLLENEDRNIPSVAIYTDGAAYHASPQHNRVGDDAQKRYRLRQRGFIPWAITQEDIRLFKEAEQAPLITASWVESGMVKHLTRTQSLPRAITNVLNSQLGSLELLWEWIQSPNIEQWRSFSELAPLLSITKELEKHPLRDSVLPAYQVEGAQAEEVLKPTELWWQRNTSYLNSMVSSNRSLSSARSLLTLNDAPASVSQSDYLESWRTWLYWSNLTAFADPSQHIVTTSSSLEEILEVKAESAPVTASPVDVVVEGISAAWQPILEAAADEQEEEFLREVANLQYSLPSLPEEGEELYGIPTLISWPTEKVAVVFDVEDAEPLSAEGWQAVEVGDADGLRSIFNGMKE